MSFNSMRPVKVLDSVSHYILLKKCTKLGTDNFWFENDLSNKTQSVRIGDNLSSILQVSFRVPQGSILGPILFSIYVNDILENVKDCFLIQYADDTQYIQTGNIDDLPKLIISTEQTLTAIKNYFNRNCLLLNSKKTQCIFRHKSSDIKKT